MQGLSKRATPKWANYFRKPHQEDRAGDGVCRLAVCSSDKMCTDCNSNGRTEHRMRVALSVWFIVSFVVGSELQSTCSRKPSCLLSRGVLLGTRLYTSCLKFFPSFSKRAGAQAGLRKEGFFGAPSGAGVRVGADVRLSVRARGRGCQAAGFSLCRGSVRTADGVTWH